MTSSVRVLMGTEHSVVVVILEFEYEDGYILGHNNI